MESLSDKMRNTIYKRSICRFGYRGAPGTFVGRVLEVGRDYVRFEMLGPDFEPIGQPCIPLIEVNWFDDEPVPAQRYFLDKCLGVEAQAEPSSDDDGEQEVPVG